ncbi:MAG: CRISPR-associated endonuclease Cas2 [bacterium]|nr:CRISPR-associated endonuclease Cas2 [bacterium]
MPDYQEMKQSMKGGRTLAILEVISEGATDSVDLIKALLSAGYGASYGKIQYELRKNSSKREDRSIRKESAERYYSLLYKLKRDGLIKKNESKILRITEKGKRLLERLKNRERNQTPNTHYHAVADNRSIIIAFDIPEIERKKRNWLRLALQNIGLTRVQKSLWMGKVKLPKEFIGDLHELKLIEFVEIFEITKTGSLKHVL